MGSSNFRVQGEIGLETAHAVQGAKQVRSEIENLGRGGIAAFEKTQQKVIDLTKRMGELQAAILKSDDPAQLKNLNNSLGETRQRLQAARSEFRGMTLDTREATEKAQMLAASLGIRLPAGLQNLIARLPAVQAGLEMAFNASIILAVGAAIVGLFPKIADWIDQLRGVEDVNRDLLKQQDELNRLLLFRGAVGSAKALEQELNHVAGDIEKTKKSLLEITGAPFSFDRLKFGLRAATDLGASSDQIKSLQADLEVLQARYEELGFAIPTAKFREEQEAHKKAEEAIRKHRQELEKLRNAELDWAATSTLNIAFQREALEKQILENIRTLDQVHASLAESQAGLSAGVFDKAGRDMAAGTAKIKQQQSEIVAANKEAAQQSAAAYERMASDIENFFNRVFLTARSFGDVMRQFTMQLVGSLVKQVSQMLAGVFLGQRGAAGQQSAFGGGILGAIFGGGRGGGGGLGIPGLGGGISTPPFNPAAGIPTIGGLAALPIGGGILGGGTGTPSAVGGATQGVGGALSFGGALTSLLPAALGIGGLGLLGRAGGRGGPVTGALGGAALALGATTGLLAAYGLPIGLAFGPAGLAIVGIAAAIGALFGSFGRGKAKNKAAGIEEQFRESSKAVLEQYKKFQVDFESALGSMGALLLQGQQAEAQSGTGKWGRKGAENLARAIQSQMDEVRRIQKQRDATYGILGGLPIPEFAVGGPVPSRGGILALLHPGEFVMQKSAVDSLGTQFLGALNRAPRFDVGGPVTPALSPRGGNMNVGPVYVFPEANMSRRQAMNMVVRGFRDAQKEGAI